jgi:hypothetical protein
MCMNTRRHMAGLASAVLLGLLAPVPAIAEGAALDVTASEMAQPVDARAWL